MARSLVFVLFLAWIAGAFPDSALGQSYPIRRSTPYERGDRWRTEITSVKTSTGTVTIAGEARPADEKGTTRLTAVVTIDQVDGDGYATVWTARIVRFEGPEGGRASATLLRPGTVVLFDRITGELTVTDENGAGLQEAASGIRGLLDLPQRAGDAPFEPEQPVKVGDEWKANVESLRATMIADGPPQLRQSPEVMSIDASGKLLASKEYRDTLCLDLILKTSIGITQELENESQYIKRADQEIEERLLIPADYASDYLDKRTVLTDVLLTEGKGTGPSLDVTQITTTTEKRTYLDVKGGGVRPWKAYVVERELLDGLLFGLDFDESSVSGAGESARILSRGAIDKPLRVKSSGHVAGKVGQAMKFDGLDDHVNVEGAPEVLRGGVEAIAVACWVKTPPKKVQIICDIGFYGGTSMTLVIADTIAKFHLAPRTGGIGLEFPLAATDWTHVAVTWDGRTQRAYVNGNLVAEGATNYKGKLDANSIGAGAFLVGSQSKAPSRSERFFAGELDEFALWTRSLDAAEIATVFEKGVQGQSLFIE